MAWKDRVSERYPGPWKLVSPILEIPHAGRVLRGAFWSVAGAAIARALSLLGSILLGRLLGVAGFGQYGMLNSTVGTLGPLSAMQAGLTSSKYVAQYRKSDPVRAARIMVMTARVAALAGALMTVVLIISAPYVSTKWLAEPTLKGPLAVAAAGLLFTSLLSSQTGALSGLEAFRELAWTTAIAGVLSLPLVIGGAYYFGVLGVAASMSISQGINWAINHWVLRKLCRREGLPSRQRPESGDYSIIWKFSIPSMLASTISGPALWACNAILVNQPDGYMKMGVFAAANQWRTPVLFLSGAMVSVLVPILASLHGTGDNRQFESTLKFNLALNSTVALVIAVPIALLAPFILAAYGKQFVAGQPLLWILLASAVVTAIGSVFGNAIVSQGRMRLVLAFNCFAAVLMVAGALVLVPRLGAMGLAIATLVHSIAYLLFYWGAIRIGREPARLA